MTDRSILITGGFGVLGRAVGEAARVAGYRVALVDRAPKPADLPADVYAFPDVDLTDPEDAATAVQKAVDALGGLDVLANVAGGFLWQTLEDGHSGAWELMHRLNLSTCLNTSRAALPHLKASPAGRIVNIGANAAVKATAGMGAYAASKAGVHRLTESLAEETKGSGVTVNAVLPSIIDTPANRADMPDADPKKWVAPADLAHVILFLASPQAQALTGALIPVTGLV
jgi:NAD(P)-dependent dehydrogenase (short-subunit alcohol dehydrogenase family)